MILTVSDFLWSSSGFKHPRTGLSSFSGGSGGGGNGGSVGIAGALLMSLLLLLLLLQPGVVASSVGSGSQRSGGSALRNLTVNDLRCGCGKKMSEELQVQVSDCTDASHRRGLRPGDLPSKGEGRHTGLKVNGRSGGRISITWHLKYIPRKKQAKLKEFRLEFTKTSGKGSGSIRRACFTVKRPAKPKVCQKQVRCEASYPKRRLRNMSVHLLYAFPNSRRTVPKFFQLKEAFRRRSKNGKGKSRYLRALKSTGKQKRPKSKRSRSKKTPVVSSCRDWHPKINLTARKENQVIVTYSPANPFASRMEITLTKDFSPVVLKRASFLPDVTSHTFEKIEPGDYSVALLPIYEDLDCGRVYPVRSSLVTVRDHQSKSCHDWEPRLMVIPTYNDGLLVSYTHRNPFADTINLGLHRGNEPEKLQSLELFPNETSYEFENLDPGDYSVTLFPVHRKYCANSSPIRSRTVTVQGTPMALRQTQYDMSTGGNLDTVCTNWEPSVQAIVIDNGRSVRVEVTFTVPSNLRADAIEVMLADNTNGREELVDHKLISVNERNASFDISGHSNKTYRAKVQPQGCKDCIDFKKHGDFCNPPIHLSNVIRIKNGLTVHSHLRSSASVQDTTSSTSKYHFGNHRRRTSARRTSHSHTQQRHPTRRRISHVYVQASHYSVDSERCSDCCRRCGCNDTMLSDRPASQEKAISHAR